MAMILKPDAQPYKDKYGQNLSNPYAVIDFCSGDKSRKYQEFRLDIYRNKNKRKNGLAPLEQHTYRIIGDEWDEFFSVQKINEDDDQYQKAYEYLHQLEGADGELVWGDWISDEV